MGNAGMLLVHEPRAFHRCRDPPSKPRSLSTPSPSARRAHFYEAHCEYGALIHLDPEPTVCLRRAAGALPDADMPCLRRGKTRLAKWYAPYSVSRIAERLFESKKHSLTDMQDDEKVKLKGEVCKTRLCFTLAVSRPVPSTATPPPPLHEAAPAGCPDRVYDM